VVQAESNSKLRFRRAGGQVGLRGRAKGLSDLDDSGHWRTLHRHSGRGQADVHRGSRFDRPAHLFLPGTPGIGQLLSHVNQQSGKDNRLRAGAGKSQRILKPSITWGSPTHRPQAARGAGNGRFKIGEGDGQGTARTRHVRRRDNMKNTNATMNGSSSMGALGRTGTNRATKTRFGNGGHCRGFAQTPGPSGDRGSSSRDGSGRPGRWGIEGRIRPGKAWRQGNKRAWDRFGGETNSLSHWPNPGCGAGRCTNTGSELLQPRSATRDRADIEGWR